MDVTVPEPGIWFFRSDTKSKSKLGGLPNLQPTVPWPRRCYSVELIAAGLIKTGKCTDKVEARNLAETLEEKCNIDIPGALLPPLHFIGQIDLSELPELPLEPGGPTLPNSGGLLFFANIQLDSVDGEYFPDHWMENEYDLSCDTRVLYTDTFGPKRKAPAELLAIADPNGWRKEEYAEGDPVFQGLFPEAPLAAKRIMTGGPDPASIVQLQSDRQRWTEAMRDHLMDKLGVDVPSASNKGEWEAFSVAMKTERRSIDGVEIDTPDEIHLVRHQMFGLAPTVQYDRGSTRHATGREGETAIPLMTFDTDWGVHREFTFCDCGLLQFWIDPEDLAARHFDRCYATTEGG